MFFENPVVLGPNIDHAILSIVHRIQSGIHDREFSNGVFLDLGKAFALLFTINHEILLNKIDFY